MATKKLRPGAEALGAMGDRQPRKGFNDPDVIRRMTEIENDIRKHSVVEQNCIVIYKSDSDDCIDGAVIFLHKGDNTHDARKVAERDGGVKNAHLVAKIPLPDNFDEENVYWNHVYGG